MKSLKQRSRLASRSASKRSKSGPLTRRKAKKAMEAAPVGERTRGRSVMASQVKVFVPDCAKTAKQLDISMNKVVKKKLIVKADSEESGTARSKVSAKAAVSVKGGKSARRTKATAARTKGSLVQKKKKQGGEKTEKKVTVASTAEKPTKEKDAKGKMSKVDKDESKPRKKRAAQEKPVKKAEKAADEAIPETAEGEKKQHANKVAVLPNESASEEESGPKARKETERSNQEKKEQLEKDRVVVDRRVQEMAKPTGTKLDQVPDEPQQKSQEKAGQKVHDKVKQKKVVVPGEFIPKAEVQRGRRSESLKEDNAKEQDDGVAVAPPDAPIREAAQAPMVQELVLKERTNQKQEGRRVRFRISTEMQEPKEKGDDSKRQGGVAARDTEEARIGEEKDVMSDDDFDDVARPVPVKTENPNNHHLVPFIKKVGLLNNNILADIYELSDAPIGSGKFGSVFRATHLLTKNTCAIKKIRKFHLSDKENTRLRREATLSLGDEHKNIMAIYGNIEDAHYVYLIQELCLKDLRQLMNERYDETGNAGFSEKEARSIVTDILEGLCHMHRKKMAHRDLKLENILLGQDGNFKLADLGFATNKIGFVAESHVGTLEYAAPEMISRDVHDPQKADIWSLGVIAYILIVAELPFETEAATLSGKFTIPANLSAEASKFIRRSLTYNYLTRPTSAYLRQDRFISDQTDDDESDYTITESSADERTLREDLPVSDGRNMDVTPTKADHFDDSYDGTVSDAEY